MARREVGVKPLLPREVDDKPVSPARRRAVHVNPDLPQGAVDRDAYVVRVLERRTGPPKIDLPDLLSEVNAWTEFLGASVRLGDGTTRMKDLPTSMVALPVSEACSIGPPAVAYPGRLA